MSWPAKLSKWLIKIWETVVHIYQMLANYTNISGSFATYFHLFVQGVIHYKQTNIQTIRLWIVFILINEHIIFLIVWKVPTVVNDRNRYDCHMSSHYETTHQTMTFLTKWYPDIIVKFKLNSFVYLLSGTCILPKYRSHR